MPSFRITLLWAPLLAMLGTVSLAQSNGEFDAQILQGDTALQSGRADAALSAADAAVRLSPDRWDGYALAGRALLALRRYEPAADALSRAIERAPAAVQPELRELRRESLLAEAGAPSPAPTAPPVASVPEVAPVPPVAPTPPAVAAEVPQAQPSPPPAPAVAATPAPASPAAAPRAPVAPVVARRGRKSRSPLVFFNPDSPEAAWTDSAGLMWARPWYYPASEEGPFDFPEAKALCAGLKLLGQQDWRLPTVEEVQRIYEVSSKAFRFSPPKFDPDYGLNEAMKHDAWRVRDFVVNGDTFNGNRVLIWSSTPGDRPGRHEAVYFGRAYSVDDDEKVGSALHGTMRRSPFHAYALCVRSDAQDQASR
ncbi:MAG TPA: DUF1566 domain-containing protein [Steroidobacteraceae bacterium]|nr:DUF1566 domain-containing protein [Steroidobacteraceae bacterium]